VPHPRWYTTGGYACTHSGDHASGTYTGGYGGTYTAIMPGIHSGGYAWYILARSMTNLRQASKNQAGLYLHRLKVPPNRLYLQEAMTIFAANFIRWQPSGLSSTPSKMRTRSLLQDGHQEAGSSCANTSAKVIQNSEGLLLRFIGRYCWQTTLFSGTPPKIFLPLFTILALLRKSYANFPNPITNPELRITNHE